MWVSLTPGSGVVITVYVDTRFSTKTPRLIPSYRCVLRVSSPLLATQQGVSPGHWFVKLMG